MRKYICIHGHFYQPPRENPWLEVVEEQDSAAPFHDWNARVTSECYAPNAAARILGPAGIIDKIVNNYSRISFNFGPTLLSWLEKEHPRLHQALIQADQRSIERWGHGNALAQVYNHIIMPLATRRDKLTQIRWGIQDFEHRFGRRPQGMWLAETAADGETLECLAAEGIAFTILAPRQAARARALGGAWQEMGGERIDSRRPYWVNLAGGRRIAVFFYDGPLSRAIAFENLLGDGARLAQRIKAVLDPGRSEDQLAHVATDGESYGHHHRFGEMALAYALGRLEKDPEVELTNYAAYLAAHPPTWEAELVEPSSWSCAHGVERWRSNCGCAVNPGRGWSQAWRTPLRDSLNQLGERLAGQFAKLGGEVLKDPWAARDDYVQVILAGPKAWPAFLEEHQSRPLSPEEGVRAAKLLEAQRWGLYMFTSCAWFFDDLAGIEVIQNLRFAARALQLAQELGAEGWEEDLVAGLSQARSNQAVEGDGGDVWRNHVEPAKVGPRRVLAHAAISGVMTDEAPPAELYCYQLATQEHHHRHNLGVHLAWGRCQVTHRRLGEEHRLVFAALHTGGHDFSALVARENGGPGLAGLGREMEEPLRLMEMDRLWAVLEQGVGGQRYSLGDLFLEGRRILAREMLGATMERFRDTAQRLYEANRDTMNFLHRISVPLPGVFTALAQAMLGEVLIQGLDQAETGPLPEQLGQVAREARGLGLKLDSDALRQSLEKALLRGLEGLRSDPGDLAVVTHAEEVLDLAEALEVQPDLWRAQNIFYLLSLRREGLPQEVLHLGQRLHLGLGAAG